jgi:hypothetical protein
LICPIDTHGDPVVHHYYGCLCQAKHHIIDSIAPFTLASSFIRVKDYEPPYDKYYELLENKEEEIPHFEG